MNIDQIASEALRLDPKDRALLVETIWESLEDSYAVGLEQPGINYESSYR